jgi:hypothetical protein
VEAERQGERVGRVVRDAVELADGRDVALTVGTVEPFGDVEDEVGACGGEPGGERLRGFQADDLAYRGERALDRVDGAGLVPLGVEIGLRKVGTKATVGGDAVGVRLGKRLGGGPGCVSRRIRFEVLGKSDTNCQRRLLQ